MRIEEKTQTNGGQESRTKYDVLDFVPPLTKINKYAVVVIIIVLSLSLVVEEKLIFYWDERTIKEQRKSV